MRTFRYIPAGTSALALAVAAALPGSVLAQQDVRDMGAQYFRQIDQNNDGQLSVVEARETNAVDMALITEGDQDGNGTLSEEEFLVVVRNNDQLQTQIRSESGGQQTASQQGQQQGQQTASQQSQQQGEQAQLAEAQGAKIQVEQNAPDITVEPDAAQVQVEEATPEVTVDQAEPEVAVRQQAPDVTVQQAQPEVIVRQPEPQVSIQQQQPEVTVNQPEPEVSIERTEPKVTVQQGEPQVTIEQAEPQVSVVPAQPQVDVEQAQPDVEVEQPQPDVQVSQAEPEVLVEQGDQTEVQVDQAGQANAEVSTEEEEQQQAQASEEQTDVEPVAGTGTETEQETEQETEMAAEEETAAEEEDVAMAQDAETDIAIEPMNALYEMTAADLMDREVVNVEGEELGEITELVLDNQNNQILVILAVGGFLGIGEKDIAVSLDELEMRGDELVMTTRMSEDELEERPTYQEGTYQVLDGSGGQRLRDLRGSS